MVRRGFTIVELLIVVAVMGILLVLAVVNLRDSQGQARDTERSTDIASISKYLESFYTSGNDSSTSYGFYPSTELIGQETNYLSGIDKKALIAPGETTIADSFFAATNNSQTLSGVTPQPDNTNYSYIYQPLQSDGTLCTSSVQKCRKYNLYYLKENDGTVYKVTSTHQ